MKTQQEIEKLTEQALNSLDGLQPVAANAYMYTKIRNRMVQARQSTVKHAKLMFRLSMALLLFLCINISSFYLLSKWQQPVNQGNKAKPATGINAVSEEFLPKTGSYSY